MPQIRGQITVRCPVGEGSTQRAVDEFTFTEVTEGTEITVTTDVTFNGLMKWIAPLLVPMFRRGGRQAVQGLAAALERVAD